MSEVDQFEQLYGEMHLCRKCYNSPGCKIIPDSNKVKRQVFEKTLSSKVFLVGLALAKETQRRSGIPYTYPLGRLSEAGQFLNEHLKTISYTLPSSDSSLQLVYSSDIIQCYPGKDYHPKGHEVSNCLPWLMSEIELVRPRVVVVLGSLPVRVLWERLLGRKVQKLSQVLRREFKDELGGRVTYLYGLQHPAAAVRWPKLNAKADYMFTFNNLIKPALERQLEDSYG